MRPIHTPRPTANERGATILVVALSMLGLLSVMALAVDVGMLLTARAEAQRAADSAALAGAGALIFEPDDDDPARAEAEQFGEMNTVQGELVQIDREEDVDVDLANERVTVRVHRDDIRGGPIGTWFARLFGTEGIGMVRYEGDSHQVVVASSGTFKGMLTTGSRQALGGRNASSAVFRTGRPARIDDYSTADGPIADTIRRIGLRCVVATPIMVNRRLWGAMITGTSGEEPLPAETESRLGQFTGARVLEPELD